MPKSAYIHIPFCLSKCKYCSFISFNQTELINEYVNALIQEIKVNYAGERLNTLYFGGGTPSLVPADLLEQVVQLFSFAAKAEITIEVNPDSVNKQYLSKLKNIDFNRISIGSQTFDDGILKLIGRRHNSQQIIEAVSSAKSAGFNNISVDLIYGLPTQTLEVLKQDLNKFISLDIQHISTYGLKIEENSYFGKNIPKNLPDDDAQADMYLLINDTLEKAGFQRYEVSNFAKNEFESKHNLNYWNNEEYYGFGVSAHGYKNGIRYSKPCTIEKYIETPLLNETEKCLTEQEKLEEEIFLGFRTTAGINVEHINKHYQIDFDKKYKNVLNKYCDYFEKTEQGYTLNLKGILLSNIILADFLD